MSDTPPFRCSMCHRGSWSSSDEARLCNFLQPDGSRCIGVFLFGQREAQPLPIEIRVIPDEQFTSWTVEGWRGGEQRYTRLFNRTADEAWHYGAAWMHGEMMKNEKETK